MDCGQYHILCVGVAYFLVDRTHDTEAFASRDDFSYGEAGELGDFAVVWIGSVASTKGLSGFIYLIYSLA